MKRKCTDIERKRMERFSERIMSFSAELKIAVLSLKPFTRSNWSDAATICGAVAWLFSSCQSADCHARLNGNDWIARFMCCQ
jgi:hypothetical protein